MSTAAASILFLCLITVSLAHFVWGFGGTWPIRDHKLLAATVIGREGVDKVPRLASLGVAILVLIAAAIGASLGDADSGGMPLTLVGLALALLFGARGLLGYTAGWRRRYPREPFAALDRKFYSPLCLVVAVCFLVLVVMRLI
jgi:fatty acid desaturase